MIISLKTCNQRFMHLFAINLREKDFLFTSWFHQIATIYCSGGKQLSKQASLATPLARGTAIPHTDKWKTKQKQQNSASGNSFFVLF